MDKDNLLRRAHEVLLLEHERYSASAGDGTPYSDLFHREGPGAYWCPTCDLLREIDESLESVGHVCDCHPVSGEYGHERGFLREDRPVD